MKIEIYEEKPKVEEEKVLRLRLWVDDGDALLDAVDENGKLIRHLLQIGANSRELHLFYGLDRSLGLKLDGSRLAVHYI